MIDALKLRRPCAFSRCRWIILVVLLFAAAAHATAATSQATLAVTLLVARHASIRVEPPISITVSPADAARGYVEVGAPVELVVQSNMQQGYTLVFERQGVHVLQARVQHPEGEILVGHGAAVLVRPAAGRGMWRDLLQLRFRFDLPPGTAPGEYPWPLHISMMSL